MKIMVKAFEIAGYTEDDLKEKFGALYNAFQFGAPPHAGMAPGVDRMIMLLQKRGEYQRGHPIPNEWKCTGSYVRSTWRGYRAAAP